MVPKFPLRLCLVAAVGAALSACGGGGSSAFTQGKISVALTDAPIDDASEVVVVFTGLLALTGFLHPEEMARLRALRLRGAPTRASTRPPDSTEMAGEVGATDIEPPQE